MQIITIKDVEQVAFSLAREMMTYDEPIPDYSTRYPNILESCLAAPFQWLGGRALYRGLIPRSSILFYLMVKNHPFQNGNQRIAITTLLVFLYINGKWISAGNEDFYNLAVRVAGSKTEKKERAILEIKSFITAHIRRIPSGA